MPNQVIPDNIPLKDFQVFRVPKKYYFNLKITS